MSVNEGKKRKEKDGQAWWQDNDMTWRTEEKWRWERGKIIFLKTCLSIIKKTITQIWTAFHDRKKNNTKIKIQHWYNKIFYILIKKTQRKGQRQMNEEVN